MKKLKIQKKPLLDVIKSSRIFVAMDTSQIIIKPQKGKGSYRRKLKHKKNMHEG